MPPHVHVQVGCGGGGAILLPAAHLAGWRQSAPALLLAQRYREVLRSGFSARLVPLPCCSCPLTVFVLGGWRTSHGSDCAKVLRYQTNKCPICRQAVESLLQIKVNPEDRGPA